MDLRTKSVLSAPLLMALALASACISKPPDGRLKCKVASECPSGWYCHADDRCYIAPEAPAADSGTSSSKLDASTPAEPAKIEEDAGGKPDATQSLPSGGMGGTSGSGGSSGEPAMQTDAGKPDAGKPDAGHPPMPVQMIALGANGCATPNSQCERAAECVSDRCMITTCETPGTICDGPAECCDLACNGGLCKCGNHSAACSAATTPCCGGLYCETGQCATCKAQGDSCAGAYQCCGTTDCYSGICQCRPMGASCDSQSVCCAGTRCDGGHCTCRAENMACDASSVCCSGLKCSSGMCVVAPGGTVPGIFVPPFITVRFACLAKGIGEACSTSSDCCSENCFDGKCVAACRRVGDPADVDSQCCSRLRANDGKCAYVGCYMTSHACTANQNCCSDRCVSGACAAP